MPADPPRPRDRSAGRRRAMCVGLIRVRMHRGASPDADVLWMEVRSSGCAATKQDRAHRAGHALRRQHERTVRGLGHDTGDGPHPKAEPAIKMLLREAGQTLVGFERTPDVSSGVQGDGRPESTHLREMQRPIRHMMIEHRPEESISSDSVVERVNQKPDHGLVDHRIKRPCTGGFAKRKVEESIGRIIWCGHGRNSSTT